MPKIFLIWAQILGLAFILSSCDLNPSVEGICFKRPSDPKCESIQKEYEKLRNTSILDRKLTRQDADRITAEFKQLSLEFSNLSENSRNLNYCISIAAKSYSNYLNVMLESKLSRKNIREIYPKNTSNRADILSLNFNWSLGEGSFIFADYVLSNAYALDNPDDLWNLIVKLNDNAVDINLACLLMIEKPLYPFSKKKSEPNPLTEILIEQYLKCKLEGDKFNESYFDKAAEHINYEYSTLDKELSHSAIFRE